jgi:sugar phosphate isomerase/epimerase
MERPDQTFATVGALTSHTHAHDGSYVDGKMQVGPLGEGAIDHATPVKLLNEAGFGGYFSVEVIHSPGSDHDAEGVLRQYAEGFRSILGAA